MRDVHHEPPRSPQLQDAEGLDSTHAQHPVESVVLETDDLYSRHVGERESGLVARVEGRRSVGGAHAHRTHGDEQVSAAVGKGAGATRTQRGPLVRILDPVPRELTLLREFQKEPIEPILLREAVTGGPASARAVLDGSVDRSGRPGDREQDLARLEPTEVRHGQTVPCGRSNVLLRELRARLVAAAARPQG